MARKAATSKAPRKATRKLSPRTGKPVRKYTRRKVAAYAGDKEGTYYRPLFPLQPSMAEIASRESRSELWQLARDMMMAATSIGVVSTGGEAVRDYVRLAREFQSEVDTPTKPVRKVGSGKPGTGRTMSEPGTHGESDDEGMVGSLHEMDEDQLA